MTKTSSPFVPSWKLTFDRVARGIWLGGPHIPTVRARGGRNNQVGSLDEAFVQVAALYFTLLLLAPCRIAA